MRIERDGAKDIILSSAELAKRFGFTVAALRRAMRLGLIAGTVEVGEGADLGKSRLTMRCGNRVWRAVLDSQDRVASEEIRMSRARPKIKAIT